ncbi:hypothetical protein [Paraburkholderia sp. MM5384-R2]|uniref:hypothetical protein n=1 Tax=Paraburkholderia sp. MM5384-R2 TaxID=2723097 RepID=UPI001609395A|nr:hypothetical protein [Paraburkholderia sp. MM5384-R2]MBB5503318.1 hypothetical protein [Paraburkholderia sp. MM5384-R2]
MGNSLHIAEPVALARPRGAHRFEGFSPKLARRLTFYRRDLLEQWILFQADPAVIVFCERPGCVNVSGKERLADFWVRYVDRQELVILDDTVDNEHTSISHRQLDGGALPVRKVSPAALAAARVWIDNWQRILPCIVANRNLVSPSLPRAIERFLARPRTLLQIEREVSIGDPVLVRAAVFDMLHAGRLSAPDLRTQALSLLTSFIAVETTT